MHVHFAQQIVFAETLIETCKVSIKRMDATQKDAYPITRVFEKSKGNEGKCEPLAFWF